MSRSMTTDENISGFDTNLNCSCNSGPRIELIPLCLSSLQTLTSEIHTETNKVEVAKSNSFTC